MALLKVQADLARFRANQERMVTEFKKDAAVELNKRAIQVLIGSKGHKGAVHYTKKATKGGIRKDLNKKYHVAGRSGNATRSGTDVKLLWILASKIITRQGSGKGLSFAAYRAHVGQVAQQIFDNRVKSIAFLAAGWLNCVRHLESMTPGLNMSGKRVKGVSLKSGGRASESWARGATPGNLVAECWNAAAEPGTKAGNIVENGLQQGIGAQIRDMEEYFEKKLEKSLQRAANK